MTRIVGVAVRGGKFLGFVDSKGRVRKAKFRRLKNSASRPGYWVMQGNYATAGPFKTKKQALKRAKELGYGYTVKRHDKIKF